MNLNWRDEYYRYHRYFSNIGKITQSAQIKSFAWLSLSIFAVSFFALLAIRPTLVTIAELNREIKDKREANRKLQDKISTLIVAQKEYAENADFLPLLGETLPEKNEFPRLAFFLEELASSSAVEIRSLGFEKIVTTQTPSSKENPLLTNSLNIYLQIEGDYLKLKDFLEGLESSRRIIKIESIAFSQMKKEETWMLSLQFSGRASFGKGVE